jgi:hypothetical protein
LPDRDSGIDTRIKYQFSVGWRVATIYGSTGKIDNHVTTLDCRNPIADLFGIPSEHGDVGMRKRVIGRIAFRIWAARKDNNLVPRFKKVPR